MSGLTNRLLARLARVVLQAFPGSFSARVKATSVGNPVRAEIAAIAEPAVRMADREGPLRLLVLGGSQGAQALNRVLPAALRRLGRDVPLIVRHQAGERTLAVAEEAYRESGVDVKILPFIDDMADAYQWADLVVCRAGALTVAEIAAAGLAAIFIPYPAAVDDHQTANATPMVAAGAAAIIAESDLDDEILANTLRAWLMDRPGLQKRASIARSLARPDALADISNVCLELARASG